MGEELILEKLQAYFAQHALDVSAAYLFGSVARGDARVDSDIDVAVLYSVDPPVSLEHLPFELEEELELLLGKHVDVIVLNHAPVDFIHRVLRDGKLALERDPSLRIRFEVKSRNEYFDLLPYLREYRKA